MGTLDDVYMLRDDLEAEFKRFGSVQVFVQLGLGYLKQSYNNVRTGDPDQPIFVSPNNPTDENRVIHGEWTMGELDAAAEDDGWLSIWMSDAWITLTYARWEEYYRKEFARIAGVAPEDVTYPVMGDMRLLRSEFRQVSDCDAFRSGRANCAQARGSKPSSVRSSGHAPWRALDLGSLWMGLIYAPMVSQAIPRYP